MLNSCKIPGEKDFVEKKNLKKSYSSWVCGCVSVKSHLTYGASVRPENAVTYSAGNEGQNLCGVFSETAPLQRSSTPSIVRYSRPFFLRKARMRMGLAPPSVFPSWIYISAAARLFAFATSSRCASPVYLLMLAVCEKLALLTGIHRPLAAVQCLVSFYNALTDGAEGLHFSAA